MTPHRYLHIFGTFDLGGAETRTVQLIDAFGAAIEHRVLVADQRAMGARRALSSDVRVDFPADDSAEVSGRPTLARLRRLARLLRGYDLILTYAWGAMDVVLAHRLFARSMRLPPLVHHEDGFSDDGSGWRNRAQDLYRRVALRGADRVVVPSATLRDAAASRWGLADAAIALIANGVPSPPPVPTPIPGLRLRDGETLVCAVAGLRREKNLPRLVRAVASAGADVRLAIIGEGPDRARIAAEAGRLGCADRVDLIGFVANARDHLAPGSILALSSDTEQCPFVVLEGMAAGLPVVSTDVGDIMAMVSDANRPFIVPLDDEAALARAIRTLADAPALRDAVGAANAARVRDRNSMAAMVAAYRDLYDRVQAIRRP